CEVEVTGLGLDAGVLEDVARLREGGVAAAADSDELCVEALERWEETQQLFGLAAVGECKDDIARAEHAQIAVGCLCGVQEVGRRAGGAKRRGDLARDDAAF